MSAKAWTVTQLQNELDRVVAGGDIDRADYARWLQVAVMQLEDWMEARQEAEDERVRMAKRATGAEDLMGHAAIALDVILMAIRGEVADNRPIEFVRDTAPWKNLMATVYGVGACGEELPKRRERKAK